jgi:hypothetical protein
MFKLMQQYTNNWDAGKLLIFSSPPVVDVQTLGYGQIYNIFYGDKRFDVII